MPLSVEAYEVGQHRNVENSCHAGALRLRE